MIDRPVDVKVSRAPLLGGAAVVAFALLATASARVLDVGRVPPAPVVAMESKDLTFEDRADGSMLVRDVARPGAPPRIVRPADGDGFVRVAVEGLVRERAAAGLATDAPFRLMRQPGGRLWLEDLVTHRRLTLDAFGSGNARAFAHLFDERKVAP